MEKPKVIAVVGPTASGKTSLAIEIARQFAGEVISADSRQVYRGLDIGTGKVTPEEMDGVPHHLLDIADPGEVYTATDFKRDATAAIEDTLDRGRRPIIAGGTFFYLELLRGNMTPAPVPPNPALREQLGSFSNEELLTQLRSHDPRRAESIDPHNRRRLIRALEIIAALGTVPAQPPTTDSPYDWLLLGITRERAELHESFRARITEWLDRGFLDEVATLKARGLSRARYKELGFEYTLGLARLEGELSEEALIERFVEQNWQYAKRQLTWLKRDKKIEWVSPDGPDAVYRRVERFLQE